MRILDRSVYVGPSLYARFPVIRLELDLGALEAWPTGRLGAGFVDALAAGGQAATTSRIENYLGFPAGISGTEFGERAQLQAQRLGPRCSCRTRPSRSRTMTAITA